MEKTAELKKLSDELEDQFDEELKLVRMFYFKEVQNGKENDAN